MSGAVGTGGSHLELLLRLDRTRLSSILSRPALTLVAAVVIPIVVVGDLDVPVVNQVTVPVTDGAQAEASTTSTSGVDGSALRYTISEPPTRWLLLMLIETSWPSSLPVAKR